MNVKLCNHLACVCVLTRIDRHNSFFEIILQCALFPLSLSNCKHSVWNFLLLDYRCVL